MFKYILLSSLLVGCSAVHGLWRTLTYSDAELDVYEQRQAFCAEMPIIPSGMEGKIERGFRILGRVEATSNDPAERWASLRQQACKIGGQAIINVQETFRQTINNGAVVGQAFQNASRQMVGNDPYPIIQTQQLTPAETGIVITYRRN